MNANELKYEKISYTVKETGQQIRKALKQAFPGTKFSLRMATGTAYGWFDLTWTDGPTPSQVDAVANAFRSSYFDGMDDSTHQISAPLVAEADGVIREHEWSCSGVNGSRMLSAEARAWFEAYVDARGGVEQLGDGWADVHVLVNRYANAADLTGIDWSTHPAPAEGWPTGSHVPGSFVNDHGLTSADYAPRHAACRG